MSDTPETDALAQLEARWREHARRQRVLIARGQCLNPAALGGMADANEARADDLAAIRRAQPPLGASAILIALTEAADELDGIINFYRPEGWEVGDLSSARELLPRLRAVLAQGWTQPNPSADAQRVAEIRSLAGAPTCQDPRCYENANVPTGDWCHWCTVSWLLQRVDDARFAAPQKSVANPPPDPSADAQRIGEMKALASDPNCRGPHRLLRCNEVEKGANVPTAMWCNWCTVSWLLQRVEQAEAQRAEQAAEIALLNTKLITDPLDHCQDCGVFGWSAKCDCVRPQLREAEAALAAARQEVERWQEWALEELDGEELPPADARGDRTAIDRELRQRISKELASEHDRAKQATADLAAARLQLKKESHDVSQVQAEDGDRHRAVRGDGVLVSEVQARSEADSSEVAAARLRGRQGDDATRPAESMDLPASVSTRPPTVKC